MKRIIGYCLIATPFVATVFSMILNNGIMRTLYALGGFALIVAVVFLGAYLINSPG